MVCLSQQACNDGCFSKSTTPLPSASPSSLYVVPCHHGLVSGKSNFLSGGLGREAHRAFFGKRLVGESVRANRGGVRRPRQIVKEVASTVIRSDL